MERAAKNAIIRSMLDIDGYNELIEQAKRNLKNPNLGRFQRMACEAWAEAKPIELPE